MLRTGIADRLRDEELADGFIRPDYDGYSFHRVPGTVGSLLDVDVGPRLPDDVLDADLPDDPATVVLLFVDAYGWNAFARTHADLPFFAAVGERARVTPLTSVFPAETAACVPTVHTGTPPVEHGLLGWDAYDLDADATYSTLPFQAADGGDLALPRESLFDGDQVYRDLRDSGVDTHAVVPTEHRNSGVQVDATFHGYSSVGAFAATLRRTVDVSADPAYVYAYYPGIDAVAHHEGPTSRAHDAQLAALGEALSRELGRVDDPDDVALCLVADHGQVSTPPEKNTVLPDDVLDAVRRDRADRPVVTGSPRNVHLHLRDDADPTAVCDSLADLDALVRDREEALDEALWGPGEPGQAFDRNCGDILVVPRRYSVTATGDDPETELLGMHGGLHPDEALVPFAPARLANIV